MAADAAARDKLRAGGQQFQGVGMQTLRVGSHFANDLLIPISRLVPVYRVRTIVWLPWLVEDTA